MSCRIVLRNLLLIEQWWPARCPALSAFSPASLLWPRVRVRIAAPPLRSSLGDVPSPDSFQDDEDPPQEAVLKDFSAKSEGRIAQTSNVIIEGTVKDDATKEWLALDQKVNSYPSLRGFTAIGTGGDDFVNAMVVAVESVLQEPIPEDRVSQKLSSMGKYVSVNIGPIRVVSSEQVQAVYNAMRRDERIKYFL